MDNLNLSRYGCTPFSLSIGNTISGRGCANSSARPGTLNMMRGGCVGLLVLVVPVGEGICRTTQPLCCYNSPRRKAAKKHKKALTKHCLGKMRVNIQVFQGSGIGNRKGILPDCLLKNVNAALSSACGSSS